MRTIKIIESCIPPPNNNLWLKVDKCGNKMGLFENINGWKRINEYTWRMEESVLEPNDISKIWVKINENNKIIDILEYNNTWQSILPKQEKVSYLVTDIQCWSKRNDNGRIEILYFDNFIDIFPYTELQKTENGSLIPFICTDVNNYSSINNSFIGNDELISLQCQSVDFLENYNMYKCKKLTNKINVNDLEYITLKNCQMWYCREYKNENQLETKYCIRTKFSNEFLKQYSIDE